MTTDVHLHHRRPAAGIGPDSREPMRWHRTMPGYARTPLLSCPAVAARLGVRSVLVKDESVRLGLPSFKILGASWAVRRAVADAWLEAGAAPRSVAGLEARLRGGSGRALVAATDGNHGRGVARMAALLGLECVILVPAGTAAARIAAIAGEGAAVRVVDGSYDDAVRASAALAGDDALVVSDTSWEGYERIPRAVVEGYSTMFHEIDDELAERGLPAPTVLALQAGVGAFAAAGLRHHHAADRSAVSTVVVEPTSADCLLASARAGHPVEVPGPHRSSMAGLNCGLPSRIAWPVVDALTDAFVAIDDDLADEAMRVLAAAGIEAGESGAAALAGLLGVVEQAPAGTAAAVGLHADSDVLLVNTEGATDPARYAAVTGRAAARVAVS